MKKRTKWIITLAILLIVILTILIFGKSILIEFSEPCGYGGAVFGDFKTCECDGISLNKPSFGNSPYYCLGTCHSCNCGEYNFTTKNYDPVECK